MTILLRAALITTFLVGFFGAIESARGSEAIQGEHNELALELGHRALQLFSGGHFEQARVAFAEADAVAHSPVFVLYQARADRQLGHLLRARALYQTCINEPVNKDTPIAWKKAIGDAAHELSELGREIPSVSIRMSGGASFPVQIEADGRVFVAEEPEATFEVDPGLYDFVAVDATGTCISGSFFALKGEKRMALALSFPKVLRSRAVSPIELQDPGEGINEGQSRPYRRGAHASFLLGGSTLILATAFAGIAWSEARAIRRNCLGTSCRPEDEAGSYRARTFANLATAGFATGLVGVGVGMGLLLYPGERAALTVSGHF